MLIKLYHRVQCLVWRAGPFLPDICIDKSPVQFSRHYAFELRSDGEVTVWVGRYTVLCSLPSARRRSRHGIPYHAQEERPAHEGKEETRTFRLGPLGLAFHRKPGPPW